MLDGRYVHLHEALGLGPMWLQQSAKITRRLPEKNSTPPRPRLNVPAAAAPTAPPAAPVSNLTPVSSNIHPARLAALQRIGSSRLQMPATAEPAAVRAPVPPPPRLNIRPMPADIAALSVCPSPADIAAGSLFSGEDGALLDRMLAAIQLNRREVHLSCWFKQLTDTTQPLTATDIAQAATELAAELLQVRPRALLLMGHFFERADIQAQLDEQLGQLPLFRIPHPQHILADSGLKRPAWQVLQQLQNLLQS